jgi:hypothetical protein
VQALALRGQKGIFGRGRRITVANAQRMSDTPATVIEPRSRVYCAIGFESVKVMNGAFDAYCRRVYLPDGGKPSFRTLQGEDGDVSHASFIEDCHVDSFGIPPQAKQGPMAIRHLTRSKTPYLLIDDRATPRSVLLDLAVPLNDIG